MLAQSSEQDNPEESANHYASHLAEVNNTQAVVATQDVFTQNGIPLVTKGARITADIAQRLLQHKLLKPIENQVKLEHTLGAKDLSEHFKQVFAKYADLKQLSDVYGFAEKLAVLLDTLEINPILYQKLTVLSQRLPEVFEKALFCAWLCALIATEHPLPVKGVRNAFIAGLFHDIGLLHIDPKTLYKKGELTQDEWRAIQSHVVIGYLIFKGADYDNPEVARAILEHHECCNGTGYPKGKSAGNLDVLGQILAQADSIQAVRINRFKDGGRTMRDTLPLLHMNSNKHFLTVYKTICMIILKAQLPVYLGNPYDSHEVFIGKLLERVDKLQDAIVVLQLIRDLTHTDKMCNKYLKYSQVIDPVIFMIKSSGIVRDELTIWLKKLKLEQDASAMRDLNEFDLMQTELLWQLKMVVRVIKDYIDDANLLSEVQRQHLQKLTDYIHSSVIENH